MPPDTSPSTTRYRSSIIKGNPSPETREATLQTGVTVSPTLSLSDPDAELEINVSVRIVDSIRPGEPITIRLRRSVFEVYDKLEGGVGMFARGAFGPLYGVNDEGQQIGRYISFGLLRVNEIDITDEPDLKKRGFLFLTIPGDGSPATVTHRLRWDCIFKREQKLTKEDLKPGEKFQVGLNNRFIHTDWWCFGDLEGDLKDTKFYMPYETRSSDAQEELDASIREGNWEGGREPSLIKWVDFQENDRATFMIVE